MLYFNMNLQQGSSVIRTLFKNNKSLNLMAPFCVLGLTISRLQSHSEGWKAEWNLEPLSGVEPGTPGLGIQCINHEGIAP